MKNGGYFLKQFFFYYFLLVILQLQATKITVIGAGYVGLVTSAILADLGHTVLCADIDKSKIEQLNNNIIPIFEPGLQDLIKDVSFSVKATIQRNIAGKRLSFSHQVGLAVQEADIIFLSVGTPTDENGQANLNALKAATLTIAKNLNTYKIICIKSTVPIGTYKVVKEIIEKNSPKQVPFDIVSNPEFLREGSALQDFLTRNPISDRRFLRICSTNNKKSL